MTLDTTWGNAVVLTLESELDNAHELNTAEICRLQILTLTLMAAEVRRVNDRNSREQLAEDEARAFDPDLARGGHHGERERFDDVQRHERDRDLTAMEKAADATNEEGRTRI